MQYFVAGTLLIAGAIHLLPLVGMISASRVSSLYGVAVAEPNLEVLMRHRAALFGLLGGFLMLAAFQPRFQAAGFVAGMVSVCSFLWLAFAVGGLNTQLMRVVATDMFAAVLLLAGAGALAWTRLGGP